MLNMPTRTCSATQQLPKPIPCIWSYKTVMNNLLAQLSLEGGALALDNSVLSATA